MKYGVAPLDPWGSVPSGTRRAGAVPIGEAWAAVGPGWGLGRLETDPGAFGGKLPAEPANCRISSFQLPSSFAAHSAIELPGLSASAGFEPATSVLRSAFELPDPSVGAGFEPATPGFPATAQQNTQGQGPRVPLDFSEVLRRGGYSIADRGKKFIRPGSTICLLHLV